MANIDVTTSAFWMKSLAIIEEDLKQFEELSAIKLGLEKTVN